MKIETRARIAGLLDHRYGVLALVGTTAIVHGIAAMHRPSAWIVGGAVAVAYAYLNTVVRLKIKERKP